MINNRIKQILLLLILALFTAGCEKDPVSSESHTVIGGFQLVHEDHDEEDHEEENHGEYAYRQLGLEIDGSITIDVGQTLEFSVHFLDSSGNKLEDHDEDHDDFDSIPDGLSIAYPEDYADGILTVVLEGEEDDHEDHDDHGMIIEVTGVSVGTTSFQIQLMHDGHSDYTSLPIVVTVIDSTNPTMFSCRGQLCMNSCCAGTIYASK
jgi:hypothetical protein